MSENPKLWQRIGIETSTQHERQPESEEPSLSVGNNPLIDYQPVSMKKTDSEKIPICKSEVQLVLYSEDLSQQSSNSKKKAITSVQQMLKRPAQQKPAVEQSLFAQIQHPFPQQFKGSNGTHLSAGEAQLSAYNYELSATPVSITPLVYSKSSPKEEPIRFCKQNAKMTLLKFKLAQSKTELYSLRRQVHKFIDAIYEQHQSLKSTLCQRYSQLERQYSQKIQQSVFYHKQEYQQLKYDYQVLKAREDTLKSPIKSEIVIESETDHEAGQEWRQERERLQGMIAEAEESKKRTVQQFEQQLRQIEMDADKMRELNHHLEQSIFDLEQQVAYHKEQAMKLQKRLTEQISAEYMGKMGELRRKNEQQLEDVYSQLQELQRQNSQLKLNTETYTEKLANFNSLEEELLKATHQMRTLQEQKQSNREEILKIQQQVGIKNNQIKQLRSELERITRESECDKLSRESNLRFSAESKGYSQTDPKALQALQVDKIILQKENTQLKATIQYMGRIQNGQPSSCSSIGYQREGPLRQRSVSQRAKELQIKQRQLMEYQSFVELQMKKLELKQQMHKLTPQSQVQEPSQKKYRPSQYTYQPIVSPRHKRISPAPGDDYGMKGTTIHSPKIHTSSAHNKVKSPRSNQFCQPQTQAIIDKVRMRQQMRQNSCCCPPHIQYCVCDARSRTSRESEESRSLRGQHYRPSPLGRADYLLSQQKNAKMKMIQDKVRRLKTQLKTSLTSAH